MKSDPLLPTDWDVIIVGTGLTESIISAACSRIGCKVLHMDSNDFYGSEWASLNLKDFISHLSDGETHHENKGTFTCTKEVQPLKRRMSNYHDVQQHIYMSENLANDCLVNESSKISKEFLKSEAVGKSDAISGSDGSPEGSPILSDGESSEADHLVENIPSSENAQESEERLINVEQPPVTLDECSTACPKSNVESGSAEPISESVWDQFLKQSNRFNLDLAPRLLYSTGSLVELLISSDASRYLEFLPYLGIFSYDEEAGKIVQVPCSREGIFDDQTMRLIEKRHLMKLMQTCLVSKDEIANEDKSELNENAPRFEEWLQLFLPQKRLRSFVMHAIAMIDGGEESGKGKASISRFVRSAGRFGPAPYLFPMYGCGEFAQAFCRYSAVFGGTFCLQRGAQHLMLDSERKRCLGVISSIGEELRSSWVVLENSFEIHSSKCLEDEDSSKYFSECISRAALLSIGSLFQCDSASSKPIFFRAPYGSHFPISAIQVSSQAGVCPKNAYITYLSCTGSGNAEKDLRPLICALADEGHLSGSKLVWEILYTQRFPVRNVVSTPLGVSICPGPDSCLDYESALEKAKIIFHSMYPTEDFLPKAPQPEDIILDEPVVKKSAESGPTESILEGDTSRSCIEPSNDSALDNLS